MVGEHNSNDKPDGPRTPRNADTESAFSGSSGGCAAIGCLGFLVLVVVAFSSLTSMCHGILNDPSVVGRAPSFASTTSTTVKTPSTTATAACPAGALDAATGELGGIRAIGWAEACRTGPVLVYAELDGSRTGQFTADKERADSHDHHGYDFTIPATTGQHRFCVWSNETGRLTPCVDVSVP